MKKAEVEQWIGKQVPLAKGLNDYYGRPVTVVEYGWEQPRYYPYAPRKRPGAKGVLVEDVNRDGRKQVVQLRQLIAQPWAEYEAESKRIGAERQRQAEEDALFRERLRREREDLQNEMESLIGPLLVQEGLSLSDRSPRYMAQNMAYGLGINDFRFLVNVLRKIPVEQVVEDAQG